MEVHPYKNSNVSKKQQVATMFDNIAWRYDFLNHFFSLGIDKIWRKKAIRFVKKENPNSILDVATGTGDFAIAALKALPNQIVGIDISEGMLEIARKKIAKKKYNTKISFQNADAENIPFDDNYFDAITVAFGVRNFENLESGLHEMLRVLSVGGMAVVLEFSMPQNWFVKVFYNFYFLYIIPFFGKIFSKDAHAYNYLPESVKAFPYGKDFLSIMQKCGFRNVKSNSLCFGIASLYFGYK